ncbi:MAG: hypothetical protein CNLJKLNK_01347 [Holosporales bacterium]
MRNANKEWIYKMINLKKMGLMAIVVLIFTKGYGSQHIRDNYGYCINNHNRHHYNFAFNVRDPQGPADFTPLNLTNFLARHWNLEGSPGVSFAGTLQGDVKAGFQEIESKLKASIAQMNHFLQGLDFALKGDTFSSDADFNTVERIYSEQGGYPGHWDRHHRSFRDHLVSRFTRQDDRSKGLESLIKQVNDAQSAEIATLKTQVQTILDGLNRANERIQQKDSAIQELQRRMDALQSQVTTLTAENQRLITIVNGHERMVDDIERSTTPTSRRSLSAGRQARH